MSDIEFEKMVAWRRMITQIVAKYNDREDFRGDRTKFIEELFQFVQMAYIDGKVFENIKIKYISKFHNP